MNMMIRRAAWQSPLANRTRNNEPLTDDQLRTLAPSIFAPAPHESRSERYAYIPTAEILTALRREGFQPMSASQGRTRIPGKEDFTKHMIRLRHGSAQMRQVGDVIPEVVLINSHDGSSSYRIMAGLFRLVCLNGAVVSDRLVDDVRVGHTGKVSDQVIEGTWSVVGQVERVMERPRTWAGITVQADEARAFARAAHTLRLADASDTMRELIKPEQFLTPRREADRGDTSLWGTFNRVQEGVIRGGIIGQGRVPNADGRMVNRRTTTRPITNIDQDVKLNRALWVLAEEFAKLKGAA